MISKKLSEAINAQVNAEFWSAYLYLSMSVNFEAAGMPGAAHWFKKQFAEEQEHAMKLIGYLQDQDFAPALLPIAEVDTKWPTLMAAFEKTLEHEKKVTAMIHNLYTIAVEDKDYAAQSMLKWFVDEQVEEEKNARDIIGALKAVNGNALGLYMIDKELGERK